MRGVRRGRGCGAVERGYVATDRNTRATHGAGPVRIFRPRYRYAQAVRGVAVNVAAAVSV
jgi:hypothetical protein